MTPEIEKAELAVIQAAMRWHYAVLTNPDALHPLHNANNALTPVLSELSRTTWKLATACPECNAGGHTCPGDGNHIPHGATDCGEHGKVKHAGADGSCPNYGSHLDPCLPGCASGTCVANVNVKGGDEAERHLAALLLETARGGWLDYAEWLDGSQVKLIHMTGGTIRVVADFGRGDVIGEFEVSASASALPPPGPEDDGVLRAELAAAEPELIWFSRTWKDVRTGDRVRMPGTDTTACVRSAERTGNWHVKPGTGTSQYNPPVPLQWSSMRVSLAASFFDTEPARSYEMDPGKPVEIEIDRETAEAAELISGPDWWDQRA